MDIREKQEVQHIFIVGAKSIGQYGGYETFVDKLTEYHQNEPGIRYHIACKANGDGFMDETKLAGVSHVRKDRKGRVVSFEYHNAHAYKLPVPDIGPAVAIWYDSMSLRYAIHYCRVNRIPHPIFYILTCRIGPFMGYFKRQIEKLGGRYYINPDGHEWKRAKWSAPVRKYWKESERLMVKHSDLVICDSVNIEKYIQSEYRKYEPKTTFIAYGSDTRPSMLKDDDPKFVDWLAGKGLAPGEYYLVVGRFVPENNYETMIREFMKSSSDKAFALVTNVNEKFLAELEEKLHFKSDPRIRFVGTVYDGELLKKIRENAYAYFHGHEVGGTNPSLLEALGSTELNLLYDVGFNREVGEEAALYWTKEEGNLSDLIGRADRMPEEERREFGRRAKARIRQAYSWNIIVDKYMRLWK